MQNTWQFSVFGRCRTTGRLNSYSDHPIHKLNKKPTEYATLCDITAISDGIVDKFVDLPGLKNVRNCIRSSRVSLITGEMLVGAYQEVWETPYLFGLRISPYFIGDDGHSIKTVIYADTRRFL